MRNITITGTTRGIGAATKKLFDQTDNVRSINRPEYDVSNIDTLRNIDFADTDVLILNAGRSHKQYFRDQPEDAWLNTLHLHMIGNMFLIQQYLKQRNQGTIVYISSSCVTVHGNYAPVNDSPFSPYVAAKGGMSAFIEEFRYELSRYQPDIRIVDIKPGATRATADIFDATGRIPSTHNEVAQGIKFAVEHPTIINIDFRKL